MTHSSPSRTARVLQRGEVGAGAGLGVADREVQLALEDPREEVLLLLVGAVAHDRRPDRVERQVGDRYAGDGGRVGEDQLLDHRAGLAAVLLRPADAEPAVGAELADHLLVDGVVAELAGRGGEPGLHLGRDERGEVLAQLLAELLLLGREGDVHRDSRWEGVEVARWKPRPKNYNLFSFWSTCLEDAMSDTTTKCPGPRPRHAAGAVRARLALPGPGGDVPATASRTASRRFGGKLVVWQDTKGEHQRPRRLLPAHGRRPDPGHGQGRRDRLPVPRLALGRRRQVQGDPLRPAGAAAGAHPEVRTAIVNDQLLVWHDAEGSEPDLDILPPRAARASDRWRVHRLGRGRSVTIEGSHCRELIDNVVDMAHFYYVHFAFPTSFRNVFEGHVATQFMESKGRPDMGGGLRRRRAVPQVRGDLLRAVVHDQLALRSTTRASTPRSS